LTKSLTYNERILVDNVLNFIESMTIKNPNLANKYETVESIRNGTDYVNIKDNENSLSIYYFEYTYKDYETLVLTKEKTYFDEDNDDYSEQIHKRVLYLQGLNPSELPKDYQEFLINKRKSDIIDNYIETNTYYRMLNGEPPIDYTNTDFIYTSSGKAIHTLTEEEVNELIKSGEYDKILEENPAVSYLFYINPRNKIDYYTSRKASDFQIMNYNNILLNSDYTQQIIEIYYEILTYTKAVIYTESFMKQEYYDSYIIIYMLMATLQRFFAKFPQNIMRRDVYDIDSLRNIFLSYGLPYYDDIPIKYQQKIVKNINTLLAYKGTDKIFVDLADIFGFKDTELYRYYLVKDYIRTYDGQPILPSGDNYETVILKFAQVSTEEKDVSSYLNQDIFYQTYEEVVKGDPYWGETEVKEGSEEEIDKEFYTEIAKQEFNYLSTKYLSISSLFNMSKCIFELNYFFNMLNELFNNDLIDELQFVDTDIKPSGRKVKLFNVVTAIYILLFKRLGYTDNINYHVTDIATIYGFNFRYPEEKDTDLEVLKEMIYKNTTMSDEKEGSLHFIPSSKQKEVIDELTRIIELPTIEYKEDILNNFLSSKDFMTELQRAMRNATDVREYRTYNSIYKYNLYSDSIKKLYGENYGDSYIYDTYSDYLRANDRELYEWIMESILDDEGNENKENIIITLDKLLESLEYYIDSGDKLEFLFTNTNMTLDLTKKYFIHMVNTFKAYTVELKKMNIYYIFDDKIFNTIKIFELLKMKTHKEIADALVEPFFIDELCTIKDILLKDEDLAGLEEFYTMLKQVEKKEDIEIIIRSYLSTLEELADRVGLEDTFNGINSNLILKDENKFINGRESLSFEIQYINN